MTANYCHIHPGLTCRVLGVMIFAWFSALLLPPSGKKRINAPNRPSVNSAQPRSRTPSHKKQPDSYGIRPAIVLHNFLFKAKLSALPLCMDYRRHADRQNRAMSTVPEVLRPHYRDVITISNARQNLVDERRCFSGTMPEDH